MNAQEAPLPPGWSVCSSIACCTRSAAYPKHLSCLSLLSLPAPRRIREWSAEHSTYYYVDTTAPNPTPTWTHPNPGGPSGPSFDQPQAPQQQYSSQYDASQQSAGGYDAHPQPSYDHTPPGPTPYQGDAYGQQGGGQQQQHHNSYGGQQPNSYSSNGQQHQQSGGAAASFYGSQPQQQGQPGVNAQGQQLFYANAQKTETTTTDRGFGKASRQTIFLCCLSMLG